MKMIFRNISWILPTTFLCVCIARGQPEPPTNADSMAAVPPDSTVPAELPANIPPDGALAQIIRLAQSGVDESVITSYINNSTSPFDLTSDNIIYLKDIGLPDDAVNAMMQRNQQLGAAATMPTTTATAETSVAQPVAVTDNYFYDTLAPYGGWVNVEGYGMCWRPSVCIYNTDWQPYCDHGHWVYTDSGWFWISDYSWGACAFHYGRWFHHPRWGWCWWPDTTWGPSWVTWRYANDYCGWAPLPPRTIFRPGAGIVFNGAVVSANFDFGIGVNFFTFVPTRNFCDPHPARFRVARAQAGAVFNRTTVVNNFSVENGRRGIFNGGIAPTRITAVSKVPIHQIAIRETTARVARGEQIQRNTLIVNRPHFTGATVTRLHQGVAPRPVHPAVISRPQNFPQRNEPQMNQAPRPQNTPSSIIIRGNGNNSQMGIQPTPQNNLSHPNAQTPQPHIEPAPHSLTGVIPQHNATPPPQNRIIPENHAPAQNFHHSENHFVSPRMQEQNRQSVPMNREPAVRNTAPSQTAPASNPQQQKSGGNWNKNQKQQ